MKLTYGSNHVFAGDFITLYVCGITPYDATHLGHAATYLTYDIVNRYLQASGKKVVFAENITDIDDPLLERAKRDNVNWEDLASSQIDLFRSDMSALHILPPQYYIPVTHVIDQIAHDVQRLVDAGKTYQLDGDIYLEFQPFQELLTPFTGLSYDQALTIFSERGGDPARVGKHHPLDPLLWRARREGEPFWETVVGAGRPGWHIECTSIAISTMGQLSTSALGHDSSGHDSPGHSGNGSEISLQGGGNDLIFPHHFMSEIQSLALTGKSFAGAYSHTGMIGLDGEKMSKSKGNLVFVSRLIAEGVDPMAIRWALLDHHYSEDLMWNSELLRNADQKLERVRMALSRPLPATSESTVIALISDIARSIATDLDTPQALSLLKNWAEKHLNVAEEADGLDSTSHHDGVGALSRAMDLLLGLAL